MFQSSGIFTHYLHAILKAIELKFQQLVSGSLPFFFFLFQDQQSLSFQLWELL